MTTWETIDTAPKDGERVLLWREDWNCPAVGCWNDSYDEPFWEAVEEIISEVAGELEAPTHWLRYPTPPTKF